MRVWISLAAFHLTFVFPWEAWAMTPLLDYVPKLDRLRSSVSAELLSREGNVDVIRNFTDMARAVNLDDPEDEIGICHLIHAFEGSVLLPNGFRALIDVFGSWEGTAAIALAAEHLNTGNGTIVSDVQDLNKRCNIRFTLESSDNENSQADSVERMIELSERNPAVGERRPCGIVGPYLSRNTIASALILGIRGYPQLSPTSQSPELETKAQYPLFGRTTPSSENVGELVIDYLNQVLGVQHLGVLYHPDEYGKSFALGLQIAAKVVDPDMIVETVELVRRQDDDKERMQEDITRSVGFLKDTQFTYFVSLMNHDFHDAVMIEAFRQGIAGTGRHNWFFSEVLGPTWITGRTFPIGSPMHLAHIGTTRFQVTAGVEGLSPRFDELETALRAFKNDQDVEYLRSVLPKYSTHNDSIFDQILYSDSFLQGAEHPSAFAYDAAIAFGLAACNASQPDGYFDGQKHYGSLLQTSFSGASGSILLDQVTGSRVASSITFELVTHHIDPTRETWNETAFKFVRSAIYQDNQWIQLEPMLFNDGTTNVPPDLPEFQLDENLLTPGLRAGALVMCSIVLALSVCLAIWTYLKRKSRVVRAAQPIFLHAICIGAFVLGCSIIPLSIDPGVASVSGCNRACMAFPWLLTIGFSLMMSALWAKTKRIYRIVQNGITFRRVAVTVYDVSKPMIGILGANIILLSVWTALSPLHLDMEVVNVDNFDRAVSTISFCNWRDSVPYYATVGAVNFVLLCYCMFVAWKAREISTELSESDFIFRAMAVILLVCFIGIPVIILAKQNPAAFFYVCSSIIFVTAAAILLLIFHPKVSAFYEAEDQQKKLRSKIPEQFHRSSSRFIASQSDTSSRRFDRRFDQGWPSEQTRQVPDTSQQSNASSREFSDTDGVMILKSKSALEDELERLSQENQVLREDLSRLTEKYQATKSYEAQHSGKIEESSPGD